MSNASIHLAHSKVCLILGQFSLKILFFGFPSFFNGQIIVCWTNCHHPTNIFSNKKKVRRISAAVFFALCPAGFTHPIFHLPPLSARRLSFFPLFFWPPRFSTFKKIVDRIYTQEGRKENHQQKNIEGKGRWRIVSRQPATRWKRWRKFTRRGKWMCFDELGFSVWMNEGGWMTVLPLFPVFYIDDGIPFASF